LEKSAPPQRQVSSTKEQAHFVFVSVLLRALLRPYQRLLRFAGIAPRRENESLAKVTPVPVAELWSSFRASDNGGSYQRSSETLISGSAADHDRISNAIGLTVEPPPFGVAEIDHAIIGGEGIIWKKTPRGIFAVSETLIGAVTKRSILPLQRLADNALYVDENVCSRKLPPRYTYAFIRQVQDNNYGHWLVEGLPKIDVLAEHFDLKSLKFIVTRHFRTRQSGPMRKIYFESLAASGVAPEQIVEVTREAIEVERLLYPLPLTAHPWIKAPRAIRFLEKLRDKIAAGSQGPKRIYVSRAHAPKRHLLNEAEILRVLKDFDITVVHPERHGFVDQVRLFGNAELVIGNYGANLTNAVFAPRGVTIFAVTTQFMNDDFFWDLANLKSGRYFSLHGKAADPNPNPSSDFVIDPGEFRVLLAQRVLEGR
jgi:Glycosyltransferase 61